VRVARGTCALSDQRAPLVAAAQAGGVTSHASAAQLWLLYLVSSPARPHVTVRRNRRMTLAASAGLVTHWSDLPDDDVDGLVTTPLRTVVDCARSMPLPEALAVADSALRRRLFRHDELLPQVPLDVRGGFIRPDLVDVDLRLVAEADGFEWHGQCRALAAGCRRYDDLVADGWTVLRFAWEQVMFDQEWVAQTLADTAALRRTPVSGRCGVRKSARHTRARKR